LAAILAADVAGSCRLIGIDEEGTVAQLKVFRRTVFDPKIADHRGRLVKNTGDGALVEFGSVVSDDAHRQIRGKVGIAFDDMGPQALKNIAEP
jgi:class 3 adenylate cyclase